MKKRIYLSPPHLSGNEINEVSRIFSENWIAPVGPDLDLWEEEICKTVGTDACCLVNSATSGIHLALKLLGVSKGDIVLVQDMNHVGCVFPITYQGATPVFIDSDPQSWNMSPIVLEEAIEDLLTKFDRKRLKAIMPVHLYGMPAAMEPIMEISRKYDIPVIEDAAESLGSTYNSKHTGTFGKIGVYSFNGNKIITTSGGGAMVSSEPELMNEARFLATQARDEAIHYEHSQVGYNYRLSNVLAGIGRAQMKVLEQRIQKRRENYERYKTYFENWNSKGFDIKFQQEEDKGYSNRWLSCILVKPENNYGLSYHDILIALEKQNIESRPLWKPMHLQPVFKKHPVYGGKIAESLFDRGLCLPSGSSLNTDDFSRILEILDDTFSKAQCSS